MHSPKKKIALVFLVLMVVGIRGWFDKRQIQFRFNTYTNCMQKRKHVTDCQNHMQYRTIDGTCNNLRNTTLGASMTPLRRLIRADYRDVQSLDTPWGFPKTYPRVAPASYLSQRLFKVENHNQGNKKNLSILFMTFGQFLDHDLALVPKGEECKNKDCHCKHSTAWKYPCFPIIRFPQCTTFSRSLPVCKQRFVEARQQINSITAFLDASQIYGSDKETLERLRKNDSSGEFKLQQDGLLPLDSTLKDCIIQGGCSLVGDTRGDENCALNTMHTLWVRQHNEIARGLKALNHHWSGDKIFMEARKIVGGMWQHIVYNEYLPMLVRLPPYTGYNSSVDPSIINGFATAAFRFGHSLIPNTFLRLNANYDNAEEPMSLQHTFRNRLPINESGIEPFMFGLLANESNNVDTSFSFGIARRLFEKPGSKNVHDLLAVNIQRGRDHGLPTYGAYRRVCGLPEIRSWRQLRKVMLPKVVNVFRRFYRNPYYIEIFPAGISEKHVDSLEVGPTFSCLLRLQFDALRYGDRFFYENTGVFTPSQLYQIKNTTMSAILCNNLKGIVSIQKNAFFVASENNQRISCDRIPKVDLSPWKEHASSDLADFDNNEDGVSIDRNTIDAEDFAGYDRANDGVSNGKDVKSDDFAKDDDINENVSKTNDYKGTDSINDKVIKLNNKEDTDEKGIPLSDFAESNEKNGETENNDGSETKIEDAK